MYPLHKVNADNQSYFEFTHPQRLNRAVHELEGILLGITADQVVNATELSRLNNWIADHREFQERSPFKETVEMLRTVLADGIISEDELADLFWMCSRFTEENEYYCQLTADMQRLHGILAGIAADSAINQKEVDALRYWMDVHQGLRGCWPYDELDSVLTSVLSDGIISSEEHGSLLRYFAEFSIGPSHKAMEMKEVSTDFGITGICAVQPEIFFSKKTFCFTGTSKRGPRSMIAKKVEERGGMFSKTLTKSVNYLIVGADGNPCWAFSCYGRKIEEAVGLRKAGSKLAIVHEFDFWDCLE